MTTENEELYPLPASATNGSKCKKEQSAVTSWKTGAVLRGIDSLDGEQLYKLLGLLIIEGRVPLEGAKGRAVGPHAYKSSAIENSPSSMAHICDNSNHLCVRAATYRDRLAQFGRLGIPLALEVVLLPDCEHSTPMSTVLHQPCIGTAGEHYLVLEHWTINLVAKQLVERKVEAIQALLQTVSSYLHFSQLSSWLLRSHGQRPKHLLYRLAVHESPLGGRGSDTFRTHDFPLISAGEHNNLQVKCVALQVAGGDVPLLVCTQCTANSASGVRDSPNGETRPETNGTHSSSSPVPVSVQEHIASPQPARPTCLSANLANTLAPLRSNANLEVSLDNGHSNGEAATAAPVDNSKSTTESTNCHGGTPSKHPRQHGQQNHRMVEPHDHGTSSSGTRMNKDATPYPRDGLENLEDIILRFSRLSSATSPKESNGLSSSIGLLGMTTRKRGMDEVAGGSALSLSASGGQLSSALQQALYPSTHDRGTRRRLRERSILFSDSISNESLDRLTPKGRVFYHPAQQKSTHTVTGPHEPFVFRSPLSQEQIISTAASTVTQSSTLPTASFNTSVYSPQVSGNTNGAAPSSQESSTTSNQAFLISSTSASCTPIENIQRERSRSGAAAVNLPPTTRLSLANKGLFNRRTGLPLQSSPAPMKRNSSGRFDGEDSPSSMSKSVRSCFQPDVSDHSMRVPPIHKDGTVPLEKCTNITNGANTEEEDAEHANGHENGHANGQDPVILKNGKCVPRSDSNSKDRCQYSTSAPPATSSVPLGQHSQHLVINFEESMLAGRIPPVGYVEGFRLDIGANNVAISQKHVCLPMMVYFFDLSDDNAPSPYLGYVDLTQHISDKRGYRLPKKGTLQLSLFNPTSHVVKVFVVLYDFSDMPANSTTFLRQRTLYMPVGRRRKTSQLPAANSAASYLPCNDSQGSLEGVASPPSPVSPLSPASVVRSNDTNGATSPGGAVDPDEDPSLQYPSYLRYLLHMKFQSSHSGRVYLHKDIRIIFSQDKFEFDSSLCYDLRSFVELPSPRYCHKHNHPAVGAAAASTNLRTNV